MYVYLRRIKRSIDTTVIIWIGYGIIERPLRSNSERAYKFASSFLLASSNRVFDIGSNYNT